jgi:hypothetical protein
MEREAAILRITPSHHRETLPLCGKLSFAIYDERKLESAFDSGIGWHKEQ